MQAGSELSEGLGHPLPDEESFLAFPFAGSGDRIAVDEALPC